jgi:ribosomal-protein-alanine N-acetyltransferase
VVAPDAEASTDGLRPLGLPDLKACLALDRAGLGGLWNAQQWQVELEDPRRPGVGLWREGALVALASGWLVVDELHVTAVVVAPPWRRRGLGRAAVEALLAMARRQGALRATLEVAAGNAAARGLYAAIGFREAGIRRRYYRNGEDGLIEWMDLRPRTGCG